MKHGRPFCPAAVFHLDEAVLKRFSGEEYDGIEALFDSIGSLRGGF